MPAHRNNFDALRLVLATIVLLSHSYPLAGVDSLEPFGRITNGQVAGGGLAVNFFFVISGYLITWSWMSTGSTDKFLRKRILRIYPGYLTALGASFFIAVLFNLSTATAYVKLVIFRSEPVIRAVLLLGYGALDNDAAFPKNPFPHAVNGSLWTLQPELFCYLIVAGVGVLGFLGRRRTIILGTVALYAVYVAQVVRLGAAGTDFTRLILFFAIGAVFWLFRDRIPLGKTTIVVACMASIVIGALVQPLLLVVLPAAGAYLLLSIAFSTRLRMYDVAARGDLSYGVYLYAFIVQQALAASLPLAHRPLTLFSIALPLTFGCAWLSWTYVERPFIKRKPLAPAEQSLIAAPASILPTNPVLVARRLEELRSASDAGVP